MVCGVLCWLVADRQVRRASRQRLASNVTDVGSEPYCTRATAATLRLRRHPAGRREPPSRQLIGHIFALMLVFPRKSAVFPRVRIPASRPTNLPPSCDLRKRSPLSIRVFSAFARLTPLDRGSDTH